MKERIRSVYTELIRVYGRVSGVLVNDIAYAVTFWRNSFPAKDGISATLSLQAMITGQLVDFTTHFLLELGEYAHTHEDGEKSTEYRNLKALVLLPNGNIQGS